MNDDSRPRWRHIRRDTANDLLDFLFALRDGKHSADECLEHVYRLFPIVDRAISRSVEWAICETAQLVTERHVQAVSEMRSSWFGLWVEQGGCQQ